MRRKILGSTLVISLVVLLGFFVAPDVAADPRGPDWIVNINGQIALNPQPLLPGACLEPCIVVLEAHAKGTATDLTGSLLISPIHGNPGGLGSEPPDPCIASLTGTIQVLTGPGANFPTVTLVGRTQPDLCSAGLQSMSLTLFADSSNGNILLCQTSTAPPSSTAPGPIVNCGTILVSGTGTVIIRIPPGPQT